MNYLLMGFLAESLTSTTKDAFMDLFDNATVDSTVLCIKGLTMLSKEIASAEAAKVDNEKLERYKVAHGHAKILYGKAKAIPPDKWSDHLIRTMSISIGDIINYTKAIVVEKDLKNMTRNDTLQRINTIIKSIEARIKTLKSNISK